MPGMDSVSHFDRPAARFAQRDNRNVSLSGVEDSQYRSVSTARRSKDKCNVVQCTSTPLSETS